MPHWLDLNWFEMFVPSKPILETVIRGSVTYLVLLMLLRLFRRQTGSVGPADLLVLLLIADASQNAMASEYKSITDGFILVATIIGWEYALDYLGFHIPAFGRVLEREPLSIIQHGKVDERHLRQELITTEELLSQLRERGVDDFRMVRKCYLEGDGRLSVILDDPRVRPETPDRQDL